MRKRTVFYLSFLTLFLSATVGYGQKAVWKLVWSDGFNIDGKPDSTAWTYERGFVRNQELQWYQPDNAVCKNGVLILSGRKEKVPNPAAQIFKPNFRENS